MRQRASNREFDREFFPARLEPNYAIESWRAGSLAVPPPCFYSAMKGGGSMRIVLVTLALAIFDCGIAFTIGCSSIPRSWRKVDAGAFSIVAPPGWVLHKRDGVDSYIGDFTNGEVVLDFDYGLYSNGFEDCREPQYVVTSEAVGGHAAKVVYPRSDGHGFTGIYFEDTSSNSNPLRRDKLNLHGQDLTAKQQDLVLKIFQTVRFP